MGIEFTPEMYAKLGMKPPTEEKQREEKTKQGNNQKFNKQQDGNRHTNGPNDGRRSDGRQGGNRNGGAGKSNFGSALKTATAPYNFVPLPTTVLPAPFVNAMEDTKDEQRKAATDKEKKAITDEAKYAAYIQKEGALSGVIELDVVTRTPFYIGAGKSEQFFSPTNCRPIIPGSTMRGMVKNIMKILTCGALRPAGRKSVNSDEIEGDGDFHDHRLYFRTFADAIGTVRETYTKEMNSGKGRNAQAVAKAGFLICYTDEKGKHYAVCPSEYDVPATNDEIIRNVIKKYEVPNDENAKSGNDGACIQWDWEGKAGYVACFVGEMNTGNKRYDEKKKKDVYAGKAHYTIHHSANWEKRIEVPPEVVADYRGDMTRRGVNLLHEKMGRRGKEAQTTTGCGDVSFVVPCFYVATGNKVKHFGFGRYYRIPYDQNISAHVPKAIKDEKRETPDFTDALFGSKEKWGSRLFFEDCFPEMDTVQTFEESKKSRILASPNPTSFQLYLEQQGDTMKTWNDKAYIRGYKLYWHHENNEDEWKHRKIEPDLKDTTPIRPIKRGAKFHGKIRFDQLSDVELGALLKVFELAEDEEVCFKLGRGKSIGMGSVRIDATLRLIEKSAYTQLFDDGGWHKGETDGDGADIKHYTKIFDNYRNKNLDETAKIQYDLSQRSLIAMLDWRKTKEGEQWTKETSTMQNDKDKKKGMLTVDRRFRSRLILPSALKVVGHDDGTTP